MMASKFTSSGLNGVWRSRSYVSACARLSSIAAGRVIDLRRTCPAASATTIAHRPRPASFGRRRKPFDGGPSRDRDRGLVRGQCDPRRFLVGEMAVGDRGNPEHGGVGAEGEHRPQAPALHHVVHPGRYQRHELADPPATRRRRGRARRAAPRMRCQRSGFAASIFLCWYAVAATEARLGAGRALLPKQCDERTPRIVRRPQHGVAGKGYTIGQPRPRH